MDKGKTPFWLENVPNELLENLNNAVEDGLFNCYTDIPYEFALEEARYILSTFSESGHANYEWLHDDDPVNRKEARKEFNDLKRYIKRLEKRGENQ
ncbi:hypothetical protein [Brevibacillus marinus]|uniref:hypothetical protein n=1 Tax=Brevibacillus marinus TaxID=2496837 RepID=UPI000F81F37A|nr:hypothetical protein [Brevibacillus marinus]